MKLYLHCDEEQILIKVKTPATAKLSFFFFFGLFAISWTVPAAYGGSQARGLIGAVVSGLRQSHSNTGTELHLRPTPQLTATLDG